MSSGPRADKHLGERLLWLDSFKKLPSRYLLIRVEVYPADHRAVVRCARTVVPLGDQEPLETFLVDVPQPVIVHCVKAGIGTETFRRGELLLEGFGSPVQAHLKQEKLGEFHFDLVRQVIRATASLVWPLSGLGA